jgi:nucleotide-binding universal stress UspA family protein
MPPPRKILFATDLSARCDRALDRAVTLARAWRAHLVAVHALEQSGDFYVSELDRRLPSWRRPPDPARIVEEQLRHDILQEGQVAAVVVEPGEPVEVIMRVLEAQGCELIITGIARDETLGRFVLGTTVDRLLRTASVPVLIAKQRVRSPYRAIVVATDLSAASAHALHTALSFFPGQKFGLFHAYRAPMAGLTENPHRYRDEFRDVAVRQCEDFLERAGVPADLRASFEVTVEPGDANRLLRQYVRDRKTQLAVLGTHGQSALFDILVGSTAKEILSALPCDVMVVPQRAAA